MAYEHIPYKRFFLLALAVSTAAVWYTVFLVSSDRYPEVTFFDVGQGDAIFIHTPNGNQILIDGGPGDEVLARVGREMPWWDRSIDAVILTHPHVDHISGLIKILERYRVGAVFDTGARYETSEAEEWKRLLKEKNIPISIPKTGDRLVLAPGIFLDILAPLESFVDVSPREIHDVMIVSQLRVGNRSVLLMGDAEKELEYKFLFWGFPVGADILKVGHHGSRTSTSEEFLGVVRPSYAVISIGKDNRYGHPNQEVIDRLNAQGVTILRTDEDGDIHAVFMPEGLTIE